MATLWSPSTHTITLSRLSDPQGTHIHIASYNYNHVTKLFNIVSQTIVLWNKKSTQIRVLAPTLDTFRERLVSLELFPSLIKLSSVYIATAYPTQLFLPYLLHYIYFTNVYFILQRPYAGNWPSTR